MMMPIIVIDILSRKLLRRRTPGPIDFACVMHTAYRAGDVAVPATLLLNVKKSYMSRHLTQLYDAC